MRNIGFIACAMLTTFALAACDGDDGDTSPSPVPSIAATSDITALPTAIVTVVGSPTSAADEATPGPATAIELTAEPQQLVCDGEQVSVVTAHVFDEGNRPVKDDTAVHFGVVALGTADPINTATVDGSAQTSVVALASQAGVVVNVSAGEASASLRIDCQ